MTEKQMEKQGKSAISLWRKDQKYASQLQSFVGIRVNKVNRTANGLAYELMFSSTTQHHVFWNGGGVILFGLTQLGLV